MKNILINAVRGTRCVLVIIHDDTKKLRHYEYEQDSDMIMSVRDGLFKWQNGDDDFRLEP